MRWFRTAMLTWLMASIVAACVAYKPGDHAREDGLKARLDAALQIDDEVQMERALAALAIEAAFHGYADIVQDALDDIDDEPLHDQTAADCAQRLWRVGRHDDAIAVADDIEDPVLRDEVLASLATVD